MEVPDLKALREELRVSIPFKRESVSEQEIAGPIALAVAQLVSIPFKRESVSEPGVATCGYQHQ